MRLVNAKTMELEEFPENRVPKYAILSHTWGLEEVSFPEFSTSAGKEKLGYTKIEYACKQALQDGYSHVWIDTCCIDKSSSAELSETINSMYRFYKDAEICYAYLEDVHLSVDDPGFEYAFRTARWFTRGWTLQELIAPKQKIFFIHGWKQLSAPHTPEFSDSPRQIHFQHKTSHQKMDEYFSRLTSAITGIDEWILNGGDLSSISIAKRMSWASKRKTTRVEDLAYCLLGIFEVHMPLLYGEGENAFIRLQEEIMKQSDDQSLFAWGYSEENITYFSSWAVHEGLRYGGVLAAKPSDFEPAAHVKSFSSQTEPYAMTNKGLRIQLPVLRLGLNVIFAILQCHVEGQLSHQLGLVLVDDNSYSTGSGYATLIRHPSGRIISIPVEQIQDAKIETIYVSRKPRQENKKQRSEFLEPSHQLWLRNYPSRLGYALSKAGSFRLTSFHAEIWTRNVEEEIFDTTEHIWMIFCFKHPENWYPPFAVLVSISSPASGQFQIKVVESEEDYQRIDTALIDAARYNDDDDKDDVRYNADFVDQMYETRRGLLEFMAYKMRSTAVAISARGNWEIRFGVQLFIVDVMSQAERNQLPQVCALCHSNLKARVHLSN